MKFRYAKAIFLAKKTSSWFVMDAEFDLGENCLHFFNSLQIGKVNAGLVFKGNTIHCRILAFALLFHGAEFNLGEKYTCLHLEYAVKYVWLSS